MDSTVQQIISKNIPLRLTNPLDESFMQLYKQYTDEPKNYHLAQ